MTTPAGRVVCAGWACWDTRLSLEVFPPRPGRTEVTSRREDVGGPAAVAALTAAALGAPAELHAWLGDDAAGARVRARLQAGGVRPPDLAPGFATPENTVLVAPDGERYILRQSSALPSGGDPAPHFQAHDVLLLDCRAYGLVTPLAHAARAAGARVVLDLDRDEPQAWALAALATDVIADEALAEAVGGADALFARLPGAALAAVTRGAAGVQTPDGPLPAFAVPVLDSTGAGDVFHGAYAAALWRSEPQPLRYAAAAAACRCQTGELPTPQAMETLTGRCP